MGVALALLEVTLAAVLFLAGEGVLRSVALTLGLWMLQRSLRPGSR